jgi:NADPH-dependent 2,4-dienoyl-CoA reductase/sulfur reductase-like enzyme/rhodanese-related sulfurtransferase
MIRKKILIVGGVAGGASCAVRARRLSENSQIIVFEKGAFVSFANCGLPYHISGDVVQRSNLLVHTPKSLYNKFKIDVRINTLVTDIDRNKKEIEVLDLSKQTTYRESYDELILSTGAKSFIPTIPGIDNIRIKSLRCMEDMDKIIKDIKKYPHGDALIIGGGLTGLETAQAFQKKGIHVTICEIQNQVMPGADYEMASLLHFALKRNGINLKLSTKIVKFEEFGEKIRVYFENEFIDYDIVISATGIKPNIELAEKAKLKIGENGGVLVDNYLQTSDSSIYAIGDLIEVKDLISGRLTLMPFAGPANKQGRIAADNAMGISTEFKGCIGSSICKVFDYTIATTGLNEKKLKRYGLPYEKIYVHPLNHASYYPDASSITIKLIFDKNNGTILGAQAVGKTGVDKRIDIIATAIKGKMTVKDLEELELCYSPPFGSAKDPVNMAGFVASNVMSGYHKVFHTEDIVNMNGSQVILDVRTKMENLMGTIENAINIPFERLRENMGDIPKDKDILVFCQTGIIGFTACRILEQYGFKAKNLTGGYMVYMMNKNKF